MRLNLLILFIVLAASPLLPAQHAVSFITEYQFSNVPGKVVLKMAYSSASIQNPEAWTSIQRNKIIREVDLIFSNYPKNKKDWITNYDSLLLHRKKALAAIAPEVMNEDIKWNYILQTNCKNEDEAKKLFHGAVFTYEVIPAVVKEAKQEIVEVNPIKTPVSKVRLPESYTMADLISGQFVFPDSIVLKVLNRHSEWKDMLVINDWTGSMYEYGAQTVLWHKLNLEKKAVRMLVFFNDGDRKKDYKKYIGNTGGIYFCPPSNLEKTLATMRRVMENGDGGDIQENDVEAIITGMRKTKNFGEVVLIADNKSHVRDLALLSQVKVPVRVILCGTYPGGPVLPDYVQIAMRTGGSLHTIEEDIENLENLKEGDQLVILNVPYIYRNGRLERVYQRKSQQLFE